MTFYNPLRVNLLAILSFLCLLNMAHAQPYMANGVKIGEVTSTSAIIWARLTTSHDRNLSGAPFQIGDVAARADMSKASGKDIYWGQVPEGQDLANMVNAVPGSPGFVQLTYWKEGQEGTQETTDWTPVEKREDFTHQFEFNNLASGTRYAFKVKGSATAKGQVTSAIESSFQTAATTDTPEKVVFTVVTGARWKTADHPDGHNIYPHMAGLSPSFFVHTGDIVYYDHTHPYATHIDLARFRWHRMYALPRIRRFHNQVPSYFMRDDHDTWQNDCWPGQENRMGNFTLADGQAVFREQTPMSPKTYRTVRWGKDLQVWFTEGRDYRSPNTMPDGPEKTIWGKEQMAWFKKTVTESDATFRILVSPSPIVGPDHTNKFDNHSNPNFTYEGDIIRKFMSEHNMIVVCGDRHWQYTSKDTKTGLLEYSCGPTTDVHSIMIKNEDLSMIKYVAAHGGFLSVTIERTEGIPRAVFRHHNVNGKVVNEEIQTAN